MGKDVKKTLLKVILKNPEGLTITEITELSGVNYMTVSKYLAVLEAEQKISHRKIGMAKLFTVKEHG
jgi:predicted transcriptional regulator